MIQVFWSVGSIFEYLVAMIVVPISGWRLLTILSAIPITIVAVFMYVSSRDRLLGEGEKDVT